MQFMFADVLAAAALTPPHDREQMMEPFATMISNPSCFMLRTFE
jgi:hypothetical protein